MFIIHFLVCYESPCLFTKIKTVSKWCYYKDGNFICFFPSNGCEIVGEIAHSIGQLDVFKNFEILVTQPGLLSSKTIFHVVLSCEQNVIEGNVIYFKVIKKFYFKMCF